MSTKPTMTLDDLGFASNTTPGSHRELTEGQLIAAALMRVADAIEDVGHKLARYLPDNPDHINENVATALDRVADAIHDSNDLEKAKHPEAAAIIAERERKFREPPKPYGSA